ncbi:hypothetical protein N8I71_00555 [Roseibacterium sp. SDUM158016]|uniref:hypothetical protein n=1 Tax=Roseicyclus sediminis TaxID=2980997 RepID=UPI0021D13E93|nr:hypothetical protein [Roseibacterium sp. SDUM158016]MCU4651305.1 hypothetical protein [Roseibacterium sp. SDUM158016]
MVAGARAIREMHRRPGVARVFTGVQPCNAPSEAVFRRPGLGQPRHVAMTVADPGAIAGGRLTK